MEGTEVHDYLLVVFSVRVGLQPHPLAGAAAGGEELARALVAGEDGGRGAELGAHIGDGGAVGHGEGLDAGAAVLHDLAHAALDAETAQDFQNDVLG